MRIRPPSASGIAIGAVLALIMGASAATAASLITSKDIKDNTVTSKDVKNESLKKGDLSQKAQNQLQGQQGPPGPAGGPATFSGPNWSIVDRNVIGNGDAFLRAGPSAGPIGPPLGVGSLGIRTGSPDDKVAFGDQVDFIGMPVSDITTLGYSVYTTTENNAQGDPNLPSILFEIDPNLESTPSGFSSMVFIPEHAFGNVWTTIDATNSGLWGLTGAAGVATGCDLNGTLCTWAELQNALDDGGNPAVVLTVQITKGRDFAFSGAVDALVIDDQMFDFEPLGVVESATTPAIRRALKAAD